MRLLCANHSAYPRVGEGAEAQRVRRAYAQRETGDVSQTGYEETVRDYLTEIVGEQAEAGCDVVTDGQVHWYDLISHPASRLEGMRINGLLRFFDTNFYVRQPEVTGELSGRFGFEGDYTYATTVSPKTVKPVLTGAYTLARYSILRTDAYPDLPSLAYAYADLLAEEVRALAQAGAPLVQIEEPSLLRFPEDAEIVSRALERTGAHRGGTKISLVTYFGDATRVFRELLHMPADMLGFDLTYAPGLAGLLAEQGIDRPVALGAVDGRNTKLDDTEEVARTVDRVVSSLAQRGIDEVHLQPSCSLEYLPRDAARRKLERTREIADAVEKVGA